MFYFSKTEAKECIETAHVSCKRRLGLSMLLKFLLDGVLLAGKSC